MAQQHQSYLAVYTDYESIHIASTLYMTTNQSILLEKPFRIFFPLGTLGGLAALVGAVYGPAPPARRIIPRAARDVGLGHRVHTENGTEACRAR